jgi:Zn-dependent oligopeptidase
MLSPDSQFRYCLLDQDDSEKEAANLKFIEGQYQRNITFLHAEIAIVEKKIAATLKTKEAAQNRFQRGSKNLFATYQRMMVFNPYKDSPEVAKVKQRLLRKVKRLVKVTQSHIGLFNSLSSLEDIKEQQEAGLITTRQKIATLQLDTATDGINTYQPPRL